VRTVGYVRVSRGDPDSLGLAAQTEAILGRYPGADLREEVKSGARARNRPVLQGALAELRRGDALVVARLDRLARSIVDFGSIIEESQRRGWSLVVLDQALDTSTANGRLVANVLASVAQWEREMIGERTRAALAVRRQQGWVPHRRTPDAQRRKIVSMWTGGQSVAAVARALGMHRETCVRILRAETGQPSGPLARPA